MLNKDTIDFLAALKENNNREWFNENKAWYQRARANVELLAAELIRAVSVSDVDVANLTPKRCVFRIYKDTRFSTDKSPYKTNFGIILRPHSATAPRLSGYYMHISPEELFISYGQYMLEPDQLKKVRRGIYNDFEMFREIIDEKRFKKEIGDLYQDEDMLKRVPNGFDKDHPAAGYMKLKHFYVVKPLTDEQVFDAGFVAYAADIYNVMRPAGRFLDDLLEE